VVGLATFNYRCKLTHTPDLNSSSMITHNSLIAFILLIFTLFNFSLLISTLQARKASQILEVVETQNIIIAMLLD
jgi:succinate-acetate transporter protein